MAPQPTVKRNKTTSGISIPPGPAPAPSPADLYPHITSLINAGGQVMIGTVAPIQGAAIAHDGKKTLVMIKRSDAESSTDLITRLDAAIALNRTTGLRVDDVNTPNSDTRYSV